MITLEEKTLDDEVDELKENLKQLTFDVKMEREERQHQASNIRIELGRLLLEKKEWEKLKALSTDEEQLEHEINHLIGVRWWKPYASGAFWSNLATPLNLSISVLSMLTAGQASLSSFLAPSTVSVMSFSLFLLSLVNTFFTPHSRIADSISVMNDWRQFAHRFEKIYYSDRQTEEEIARRMREYRQLMMDMKEHIKESPDKKNLFEDLIYFLCVHFPCGKKLDVWIEKI
jgi:hypothetical protein